MSHWAEVYLGEAWTPVDNNCWEFVRRVWGEQFGLVVPEVEFDASDIRACVRAIAHGEENKHWQAVEVPQPGDAVMMGRSRKPSHIGVWTGEGVLHCMQGPGVIHNTPQALWITGLKILSYHRRKV